jgi:hypothetical protein
MKQKPIFLLAFFLLAGCGLAELESISTPEAQPPTATLALSNDAGLSAYAFPDEIDPAGKYLFYLHGKIIEDQGIPCGQPRFW